MGQHLGQQAEVVETAQVTNLLELAMPAGSAGAAAQLVVAHVVTKVTNLLELAMLAGSAGAATQLAVVLVEVMEVVVP